MEHSKWLDIMGIGKSKPTVSNCPTVLSMDVKSIWPHVVEDNASVIAGMSHSVAWNFILSTAFAEIAGEGKPWLDIRKTGNGPKNAFSQEITARRALTVTVLDTTQALSPLVISNITREVDFFDGNVILKTQADAKIVKGESETEWLTNLVNNRFKVFGYTYRLFGLPAGSKVEIENHPSQGIKLRTELNVQCTYIPSDAATPIINPAVFEKIITDKFWIPATRKFKYKTTRRKNSLL